MIILISLLLENESNEDEKRIPIILPNPRKVSVQLKLRKKNPLYMKARQNTSLSHSNLELNFSFTDGLNFTIFLQWTSHIDIPLVCFYPSHPFFLFFGFFWWHIQMDTFIHKSRTYPFSYLYKRSTISRLCHFIIPYLSKTVNPSTIVHESYHCSLSLSFISTRILFASCHDTTRVSKSIITCTRSFIGFDHWTYLHHRKKNLDRIA